jgi:hypothetical protein
MYHFFSCCEASWRPVWDVASYSLIDIDQCYRGAYCIHHHPNKLLWNVSRYLPDHIVLHLRKQTSPFQLFTICWHWCWQICIFMLVCHLLMKHFNIATLYLWIIHVYRNIIAAKLKLKQVVLGQNSWTLLSYCTYSQSYNLALLMLYLCIASL